MKGQSLFVGTYISKKSGSISRAEELAEKLNGRIVLCSNKKNKVIRILDIIKTIILFNGENVIIDTYSGQAFVITEIASLVSRIKGLRVILILRGGALPLFYERKRMRVDYVLNKCSEKYSPSHYLIEHFGQKGFNVGYLPNWVDTTSFFYERSNIKSNSLLWVRSFSPIYNPILAINVLDFVRDTFPDATLTMVGPDHGMMSLLLEELRKLKLVEKVKFVGAVRNEELHHYYHSHSVFLNTTSYESFGVALMEAAASGIPIVTSDVGEIPFLWEKNKDVLMYSIFDKEIIGEEVIRVLSNEELALSLSQNARRKSENYSYDKIYPKWKELLNF